MLDIKTLLNLTVEKKASDLHLTVDLPPQLRIDGRLGPTEFEKLTPSVIQSLAYSILTKGQIEAFEKNRELDLSFGLGDISRFRINMYWQRGSIALTIRRVPFEIPTFEELGLPEIVKEFADRTSGLFLVTGVVGSGKSTTLAAMIEYINNKKPCHIISIEDPIEYLYRHKRASIDQREVGSDTLSFANALRHVFRQDPNIILIGEMRDLETIHAALTLAETGHLILGTLHTGDAPHSVSRIVDVFPPYQQEQIRIQLSLVLIGVLAQQLIPRARGEGRVLATEAMNVTPPIRNLIRENELAQIRSIIQVSRKYNMWTMNQSLADLCQKGVITWEQASKRTTDLKELTGLLKRD